MYRRGSQPREEGREITATVNAERWEVSTIIRVDAQNVRDLYEGSIKELDISTASYYIVINQAPKISDLVIILARNRLQDGIRLRGRQQTKTSKFVGFADFSSA